MQTHEEKIMTMALNQAKLGIGKVEPNPAVGCVIEKGGQIIGKGYHKKFGEAHAEVNALADCTSLGASPEGATVYVTLEPCCHHGKTGPCTEALIQAGVSTVVMACEDPFKEVSGKGRQRLEQAGIRVVSGVCEQEARILNAPFFYQAQTGKTWVVLKWAQSIDAQLAYAPGASDSPWISNEASLQDVHKLRRRTQAILVGINTVLTDNPMLTPRPAKGHNPLRIVMDNQLRIPIQCRLVQSASDHPLLVATCSQALTHNPDKVQSLEQLGVECLPLDNTPTNLHALLDHLSKRNTQQLLVEGGPHILTSFLRKKLSHEICVYISSKLLCAEGTSPLFNTFQTIPNNLLLHHVTFKPFNETVKLHGYLQSFQK